MAEYIPLSEFAEKLGVTEDKIQELRERGKLRAFRDGSSWKFKDDELEKARGILAEEGGPPAGESESQEFELSAFGDSEEGSSGSMDSLLIEDTGESADGGSSNIISESSEEEFSLEEMTTEAEDSGLSLDLGTDTPEAASIDKPAEEVPSFDDDELSLGEDDADINLGGEPLDPEGTGSGVSLALEDESLDLGTSGIGMDHDSSGELTLDIDDDEDSSMDLLASESEMSLEEETIPSDSADDSELSLMDDASDSGVVATDDSAFSLSTGDSGLELFAEEDAPAATGKSISASDDEELFAPAGGEGGEAEFLLTPVEGELEDDDSGSQVIALDSDSMSSESGLFGSSTLEGGDFGGLGESEGLEADDAMATSGSGTMSSAAPAAAAPAEVPYTALQVASLGFTAFMLLACGLMVTDLTWNMWSYNEPYSISSTIMDSILGMLG
ncbi:excisionase family DNA-binding protein [Blastopirellula marina]|uniref:Uncharacterized protein n=1 Tax=Blastopirellula marina TaxID=124 RepID=A0A2S8GTW6_9BACT|nr:excisionase family DNA-binding protein [Blastopirellula marina]PQO47852.1 hypothetical protein C5Y93_02070 [Blastopirellula marina]